MADFLHSYADLFHHRTKICIEPIESIANATQAGQEVLHLTTNSRFQPEPSETIDHFTFFRALWGVQNRSKAACSLPQIGEVRPTGILYEILPVLIHLKLKVMLRWTIIFLVIAIIAAIFGFGGIAAGAAGIAKILFFIFLVLFILSLIAGRRGSVGDGI